MPQHITEYTTEEVNNLVRSNADEVWKYFGAKLEFSPYEKANRSALENATHERIVASWPRFAIGGGSGYKVPAGGKAPLWEIQAKRLGAPFLCYDQKTGSCVGDGLGGASNTLSAVEAWVKGEPETVRFPLFWLYPYGISRWLIDPNDGPGEGSFGTAGAEAVMKYGIFANDESPDLPKPSDQGGVGLTWGERTEMEWSFINPGANKWARWQSIAKIHLLKTSSVLRSAEEVAEAIINGYPCTCASNWGGLMRCPTEGNPPVLINKRSDTWPHQQFIEGWWDHPTLGEIFFIKNSWSIRAHGICPSLAPQGGYWVRKPEVAWMCRNGEVIVYSQYNGYPAAKFDWRDLYN